VKINKEKQVNTSEEERLSLDQFYSRFTQTFNKLNFAFNHFLILRFGTPVVAEQTYNNFHRIAKNLHDLMLQGQESSGFNDNHEFQNEIVESFGELIKSTSSLLLQLQDLNPDGEVESCKKIFETYTSTLQRWSNAIIANYEEVTPIEN
jgi:hypothetical protein